MSSGPHQVPQLTKWEVLGRWGVVAVVFDIFLWLTAHRPTPILPFPFNMWQDYDAVIRKLHPECFEDE